jgi:hypothetical protein
MKVYCSKEIFINASRKIIASPLIWILILTIFLLRTILFTPGIPSHGDLTYPSTIIQYQKALFPLWNESTSVSNLESIDRGFSLLLVLFVRLVGGEVDLLSKLYFFIPLFVSGITTAYLTKYILHKVYPERRPNTLAIVVASFVFMISPWVLEQVQAPFFWLSYAVTPGIILLAYRFFSERRLSFGIGLAILLTLASTTPHYTLFSFLITFFAWLCTHIQFQFGEFKGLIQSLQQRHFSALVKNIKINWGFKKYLKDLKLWVLIVVVFIALNAYWIVMTIFLLVNGSITPGYVFTPYMLQLFSSNANLQHVFSGTDQWISWWPGQYSDFIKSLVVTATIALPAILLIALGLAKKGKGDLRLLYILIGIWIVGVFFSSADKNPVYIWLATGSPLSSAYGWLLRVPGKISFLLWPAYAVCAGLVMQSAYSYCSSKKKSVLRKKMLVLTVVAGLLIASSGYAVLKSDDYFNYYYAPVKVPAAYQQAFSYINANLIEARIADFARYENGSRLNFTVQVSADPYSERVNSSSGGNDLRHSNSSWLNFIQPFESSYTWNQHRIAGYFVPRSISVPNFGYYHFTYSGVWRPAYTKLQESITYVVYENLTGSTETVTHLGNVSPNAALWLPVYGANYLLYHNDIFNTTNFAQHDLMILNQTGCQLVQQWGDYIYLYRVPQSFGRIYALNSSWASIETQQKPPTSADVNSSGVNIYDIRQVDATHWEINLNATESFSLIFTEGFDSFWAATVKTNNDSFVYSSQNAFGSINSFPINQTGELHVTIQYRPQTWLYYGITVSILLLIAITVALSYFVLIRKINRKTTKNWLVF